MSHLLHNYEHLLESLPFHFVRVVFFFVLEFLDRLLNQTQLRFVPLQRLGIGFVAIFLQPRRILKKNELRNVRIIEKINLPSPTFPSWTDTACLSRANSTSGLAWTEEIRFRIRCPIASRAWPCPILLRCQPPEIKKSCRKNNIKKFQKHTWIFCAFSVMNFRFCRNISAKWASSGPAPTATAAAAASAPSPPAKNVKFFN